jgi:hypothetical protein
MQTSRKHLALLAIAACAIALAGCEKKEEAAAPASSSAPPASSAPAAPSSSSSTPAPAAPAASTGSTASIPAECEAYVQKVNACVSKLGQGNPAMAAIKQQLDTARSQWGTVSDQGALAAQCKQSNDLFSQSSAQMGC